MDIITQLIRNINWDSPGPILVVVLMTVLAIMRKWYLLTMLLFLITLSRGLCYLHMNSDILGSRLTAVTLVYLAGGVLMSVFATIEFFVKQ